MELPTINYQNIFVGLRKHYRQLLMRLTSCDLCNEPCTNYLLLCQSCHNDLPIFNLSDVQGDLLNWPAINKSLPKIQFDYLICLSPYTAPFDKWISQLKYQGRFEVAKLLAELLATHYLSNKAKHNTLKVDLIISVPLHVTKWQQRGFNQAHLLSTVVAQKTAISYDEKILCRKIMTTSQVGQSGNLRRKNLKNIFDVNFTQKNIPNHVLLIDDVVTTGATASEISRCLKLKGVKSVTVLAVCLSLANLS